MKAIDFIIERTGEPRTEHQMESLLKDAEIMKEYVKAILEERKKVYHDLARGSLVDNYYDELEDANYMYGVYISVLSDIKEYVK